MRIIYHPAGQTLRPAVLRQMLNAALADMSVPVSPLVALDIGLPDYPYQIGKQYLADDRKTLGGATYSRVVASLSSGALNFSGVHSADIAGWRAWFDATNGFRLPFAVELPDMQRLVATAAADRFPLVLVDHETWDGSLNLSEQP